MSVDLRTKYLGLELKNPLIVAACPLTQSIDNLKRLEEHGGGGGDALALRGADHPRGGGVFRAHDFGTESFAESLTYFPEPAEYRATPDIYLDTIRDAKKAVSMPIIGSLNGISRGGWTEYARRIEEAGPMRSS